MRRFLVALALVLFPVAALAQSLGQAAAQERERREKKARDGKPDSAPRTYTDDDLKSPEEREKEREKAKQAAKEGQKAPSPPPGTQPSPYRNDTPDTTPTGTREGGAIRYEPERPREAPREATSASAGPVSPPPDDNPDAVAWRERARPARGALDAARAREGVIEGRIAQLRQEINPMSANYHLDPNRFLQVQEEIRTAEAELASARQETRAAQEAWEQILEEARRAGVRPDL